MERIVVLMPSFRSVVHSIMNSRDLEEASQMMERGAQIARERIPPVNLVASHRSVVPARGKQDFFLTRLVFCDDVVQDSVEF